MEKLNKKELAKIFNGIKNNNEQSFNDFYKLYYKLVYNIAFSVVKNNENCEDVTQNVFEKIYKMSKRNLPEQYEASWLYTVTKNEALQYIKKQKPSVDLEDIYQIEKNDKNLDLLIDTDYYNSMMKRLKQKEKEIVTLKIMSNLTFSQIGKVLNMPTGTVQWNYYKSINTLKISLSTLATALVTFVVGLSTTRKGNKIDRVNSNINVNDYNKSSENEYQGKEDNPQHIECEQTTINKNKEINTNNEVNQILKVEQNLKDNINVQTYTFFCISFLILVIGIIVTIKIKNKIYKKSQQN